MKLSSKFFLLFSAVTLVFALLAAGAIQLGLDQVNKYDHIAISGIIAKIKEKYPDVTDNELAEILNGSVSAYDEGFMHKYGIAESDTAVLDNRRIFAATASLGVSVCLGLGCASLLCFAVYVHIRKKHDKTLTRYLSRINSGNYRLRFDDMKEDPASVLSSEIYKTTVMLREQSERNTREKEKLKDSLSDISHQLKTPLTSITLMLDSIIEGDMPEDLKQEFLGDIKNSVTHLTFLTQALLTLSKLDSNTVTFKDEEVRMKDIIGISIANTQAIAQDRGVTVRSECPDITLRCDLKWGGEAVTNIVKNCIEHTDRGGSVILRAEENPLLVKLTITDNGCGIEKKDLPHIFERFYKSSSSGETGIGIGLALSKSIVEKCGGYISAASEVGKGSKFTIKFFRAIPRKDSTADAPSDLPSYRTG